MGLKDRLIQFIEDEGLTVQEFERRVGLSNGAVSKMGDNTRMNTLEKISTVFPLLDIDWLRTGMVQSGVRQSDIAIMDNTVKERVYTFLESKGMSVKQFEGICGLSNGYIGSMRKGFGETKLNNVLTMFPELNRDWLLYGEGEMLNDGTSQPNLPAKGIKILDIRVCAGYGIGFDGDENKVLDVVNIPQYNGCYGVTVYGDSMYDIYAPGDIVFVREVTDKTFIDNGQAYIVITAEDRLLKLLYVEDEKITLVSYNTTTNPDGRRKYPDICMKPESIIKLYKVVGRLTRGQM